jgi:hypothetical protein
MGAAANLSAFVHRDLRNEMPATLCHATQWPKVEYKSVEKL